MTEQETIEKYTVTDETSVTPIIVLTDTIRELEDFCHLTKRNLKTAIPIKQGYQLALYPDLEIVHWGQFWLNGAYDSPEYKFRIQQQLVKELEENG